MSQTQNEGPPGAPAAEPVAPAAEPVAPAAEPIAPAAEPVAPAAEPVAPAAEPVAPANNPAGTTIGGTLLKRMETIVDKILILGITTVIGDVTDGEVTNEDGHLKVNFSVSPQQVACTTINMALGDLTTVYSPQFADNAAYAKLHSDNLAIARGVRSDTMDLLLKGVEAVKALAKP